MTFQVVILPSAVRDIDRNAAWWAEHHSVEQAVRWLDAVYARLEMLSASPESHGFSAENAEFPYPIRETLVGLGTRPSHRAIFTIQGETVYVLSVRHGAQDSIRPDDLGHLPP